MKTITAWVQEILQEGPMTKGGLRTKMLERGAEFDPNSLGPMLTRMKIEGILLWKDHLWSLR